MKRIACAAMAAGLCLAMFSGSAQARQATSQFQLPFEFDGRWSAQNERNTRVAVRRGRMFHGARRHLRGYTKIARRHHGGGRSVTLAGVVSPLADKAREIVSACGSVIISARNSRNNRSNHPIGRAVDIQGNPGCIYAHLHGWPGGYSTDYARAPGGPHVHISYNPGGQEWGLRFAHRHYRTRYAYARRHHRYARI